MPLLRMRGHRALRKGRYTEAHRPYLLTTATAHRTPLFADLYSARILIRAMHFLHDRGRVDSLAFVVMPDHFHWLCIPYEGHTLSAVMHSLKSWTANELNKRGEFKGPIWQAAYHDRAMRSDEDIREVARYIVANPLRAGLAEHIGEYSHWDAVWL